MLLIRNAASLAQVLRRMALAAMLRDGPQRRRAAGHSIERSVFIISYRISIVIDSEYWHSNHSVDNRF